jgi:hypothetical protein
LYFFQNKLSEATEEPFREVADTAREDDACGMEPAEGTKVLMVGVDKIWKGRDVG